MKYASIDQPNPAKQGDREVVPSAAFSPALMVTSSSLALVDREDRF